MHTGAFTGRSRPTVLRLCALLAALAMALGLASCGNATDSPDSAEAPSNLITRAEVSEAPEGGVKQAFLEYWSALQFQAWAEAAAYFDPAFRSAIGTGSIIGAKRVNGASYPDLKPTVTEVTSEQGLTTVRYYVWLADGTKELASATWRKVGGNWQIVYESRLDAELNQLAINDVEIQRFGTLPTEVSEISPAARKAGNEASQAQARFAEEELDVEVP